MPPRSYWGLFFLLLVGNYLLVRLFFPGADAAVTVPYTLFKEQVTRRNVVAIHSRGASITGRLKDAITYPRDSAAARELAERTGERPQRPRRVVNFDTELPAFADPGLEALLIANGVEISAKPIQQGNPWLSLLYSFAPALLIIGLYVWLFRRASKQGGGMGGMLAGGLGKSTARRFDQATEDRVTFEDVAGIDEA
jgi:cell division protease FtsH